LLRHFRNLGTKSLQNFRKVILLPGVLGRLHEPEKLMV